MSETPLLALPLIEAAQAQKHITHNEALLLLDAAIHLAVISRSLATPPASPADGDRYLVATGATGAWAGHVGQLAFREAGAWRFAVPRSGWRLWAVDEQKFLLFDGAAWRDLGDIDVLQDVSLLGVNTTADASNRLSVSSPASLLSHEGAGHQLKINKQAAANTASLLFQTNFSGRAEMGLAGDDNFHFKVSPDGAAWNEAIQIDKTTGLVTLTANSVSNAALADMATARIKGRATAGTGNPEDLTATQATALLDTFTGTAKGLVPASGGGTANFLRADGAFAAPSGGGSSSVASIAALRLLTTASYSGTTVYVESWTAGLNRGGGHFYYDSASAAADDGGLVIVDASSRRWLRQIEGGRISPGMFGAKGDGTTDDAAALQSAIDAMKASFVSGQGFYTKYVDGEGLSYYTATSLNATGIVSGRDAAIVNITIIGGCTDRAVVDATGSQYMLFDRLHVVGNRGASDPDGINDVYCGLLIARNNDGAADSHSLRDILTSGYFKAAGLVLFGSETDLISRFKGGNARKDVNSATAIVAGNSDVFTSAGLTVPTSLYATINAGSTSQAGTNFVSPDFRRGAAVTLTIASISKANPAVVTVSSVSALNTAITSHGFGNGSIIHLDVTGMSQVDGFTFTVANLNAGAGTFELSGVNSTAYSTFTGGTLRSKTGPILIIGNTSDFNAARSYWTSFGSPAIKIVNNSVVSTMRKTYLSGRCEPANEYAVEINGAAATAQIYKLHGLALHFDSSVAKTAVVKSTKGNAGSSFTIEQLDVSIMFQGQVASAGLFETPADFTVEVADVRVPTENISNAVSSFAAFEGDWRVGANGATQQNNEHWGSQKFNGPTTFKRTAAGAVNATALTEDDGASAGPFLDLDRKSSSPAVSDLGGTLRFLGRDSAGNATTYAALRQIINSPTDGAESGQLDIQTMAAGTLGAAVSIKAGVQAGAPTGGDKGAGTLNLSTALYIAGTKILDSTSGAYSGTSSGTNTGDQTITLTGDVTGSGTGSFAATVAADAVSYAKMQNISASQRVLGRNTAGAGDPEEVTASQIFDWVGSTQGTILYRGAAGWAALTPGTSGQVLKTQGAGANPVWGTLAGSGDVVGPASATDNALARFDLATGKLIQNSSVILADDGSMQLPEVVSPSAAAADTVNFFALDVGARTMPAFMGASGRALPIQPLLARNKVALWSPPGNATTVPGVLGLAAPTALGTATARNVATTNLLTRLRRLGYVSATTAGSLSGHYMAAAQYTIGNGTTIGGFHYVIRFGVSDAATQAGARMFVGLRNAVAAPTNVEPNTLTNAVGVAQLSSSANLQIVYGGSAAQTAIDLGVNFPANTLSADAYELSLFAPVNSQVIHYRLERLNTGNVAAGTLSGTVGTAIPAATTFLGHTAWRTNNANTGAVGLDIVSVYIESDC